MAGGDAARAGPVTEHNDADNVERDRGGEEPGGDPTLDFSRSACSVVQALSRVRSPSSGAQVFRIAQPVFLSKPQSRPRQKPRRPPPRGSRASERTPRPPEVRGRRRGPSDANRTLAAAGWGKLVRVALSVVAAATGGTACVQVSLPRARSSKARSSQARSSQARSSSQISSPSRPGPKGRPAFR